MKNRFFHGFSEACFPVSEMMVSRLCSTTSAQEVLDNIRLKAHNALMKAAEARRQEVGGELGSTGE